MSPGFTRGAVTALFAVIATIPIASCGDSGNSHTQTNPGDDGGSAGSGGGGGMASCYLPDGAPTECPDTDAGTSDAGMQPMMDSGQPMMPDAAPTADATPMADAAPDAPMMLPDNCGDGVTDPNEDCDDGNDKQGDGCDNDCRFTCEQNIFGDQYCSDGRPCNGKEKCGPDHTCVAGAPLADNTRCGQDRYCRSGVCTFIAANCGDGLITDGEDCEDGNTVEGDGCDNDCRYSCSSDPGGKTCEASDVCAGVPACDDSTHMCIPGTPLENLTPCGTDMACVDSVCTSEYCSNGTVDTGEQCDDGNVVPGDGCEPDCSWTCEAPEDCDPGIQCFVTGGCDTDTHTCNAPQPEIDGTSCPGNNRVCVSGICRTSQCGDGALDPTTEDCDDGNNIDGDGCDNDCTFSCEAPADCTGTPRACRKWDCQSNVCVQVADSTLDGNGCDNMNGGGSATCSGGVCTAGTCGDSSVDTGEECDLGPGNGPGTGCEVDCTLSCHVDADCDNGDPCDGTETCNDSDLGLGVIVKVCSPPDPSNDGTLCGNMTDEICVSGVCQTGFCGDGYTDTTTGEECDPPNPPACTTSCEAAEICNLTGVWAVKTSVDVTWAGSQAIAAGSGTIEQWALMNVVQDDQSTVISGDVRPCGLSIPDFGTTPLVGTEIYGLTFPDKVFDGGAVPASPMTGTVGLSPGSSFSTGSLSLQIGLALDNPFAPWPSLADTTAETGLTLLDPDNDGKSGATAPTKTGVPPVGGMYSNIIVDLSNLDNPGRADRMHLVVRQIASQSGTLTSCTEMSGSMSVTSIDNHIIGCRRDTGADCEQAEYNLADTLRPRFQAQSSTFAAKMLSSGATCADVRAAYPTN